MKIWDKLKEIMEPFEGDEYSEENDPESPVLTPDTEAPLSVIGLNENSEWSQKPSGAASDIFNKINKTAYHRNRQKITRSNPGKPAADIRNPGPESAPVQETVTAHNDDPAVIDDASC